MEVGTISLRPTFTVPHLAPFSSLHILLRCCVAHLHDMKHPLKSLPSLTCRLLSDQTPEPAKVTSADMQQAQPLWHEDTRGRPGGGGGSGRGGGRYGGGYNNGPQQHGSYGHGGQYQGAPGGILPDAAHRMLNVRSEL